MEKFADAGVTCAVNIDPILPNITDSQSCIQEIIDGCDDAGARYVFGALLRLRSDIWERMKIILELLDIENGIEEYTNDIYQFREPLKQWYNITVNKTYETKVIQNLKEKVVEKGMIFDFPDFIGRRCLNSNKSYNGGHQVMLMSYM